MIGLREERGPKLGQMGNRARISKLRFGPQQVFFRHHYFTPRFKPPLSFRWGGPVWKMPTGNCDHRQADTY